MDDSRVLPLAAGFGAIAGLRSFSAPTALLQAARFANVDLSETPLKYMTGAKAGHVATALALGEFIADKTKFIPNRTELPSLLARAASGAVAGASVARARKTRWWPAALAGAAAALGATFAAFHLRKLASQHVPDGVVAVAEDAIVIGAGLALVSSLKRG